MRIVLVASVNFSEIHVKKRSPLKDKPLRNPGQSLDEKILDVLFDNMMAPALLALVLTVIACMEWAKAIYAIPPAPKLYTGIAFFAFVYAGIRIWRIWPKCMR